MNNPNITEEVNFMQAGNMHCFGCHKNFPPESRHNYMDDGFSLDSVDKLKRCNWNGKECFPLNQAPEECKECLKGEPHGHCEKCNLQTEPLHKCKCPERNYEDGSWNQAPEEKCVHKTCWNKPRQGGKWAECCFCKPHEDCQFFQAPESKEVDSSKNTKSELAEDTSVHPESKEWEIEFGKKFIQDGEYEHPFFDVDSKLVSDIKFFIATQISKARSEGEAKKGEAKRIAYQQGYDEARREVEKIENPYLKLENGVWSVIEKFREDIIKSLTSSK